MMHVVESRPLENKATRKHARRLLQRHAVAIRPVAELARVFAVDF